VRKKISITIGLLFVFLAFFSGCINSNKETNPIDSKDNSAPIAVITAPEKAYFEDKIIFDASDSYDTNGNIVSYEWNFGDGQTSEGKKVEHIFKFENNFEIEYPLIYTVILCVKDNDDLLKIAEHQIMLSPSRYMFYLTPGKLIVNKPDLYQDTLDTTGKLRLNPAQELSYELENSIKIQECKWNATIYMKKPILAGLDRIIITIYNKTGIEISKGETFFKKFEIWKEKTILIKGDIPNIEEIKSVKISVYGLLLGKKINIFYGADKASYICFNFIN